MKLLILNLIIDVSKIILQFGAVSIIALFSGYLNEFEFLINNPNNDILPTFRLIKHKMMYKQHKKKNDDDNDKHIDIFNEKQLQNTLIGYNNRTISCATIILSIILFFLVSFFGLLMSSCIQDYQKFSIHDGLLEPVQPLPLTAKPIPASSSINNVLALMHGKDYAALDHYEIHTDYNVQVHFDATLPTGPPPYGCQGVDDGLYITDDIYQVQYFYSNCNTNVRPITFNISATDMYVSNATFDSIEKGSASFVRNTIFHLPKSSSESSKLTVINVTTHQYKSQPSDFEYYLQTYMTGCHNLTVDNYRSFNTSRSCIGSKSACYLYPFDYNKLCNKDGIYERIFLSGDSKGDFTAIVTKFILIDVTTPYEFINFFNNHENLSPTLFTPHGNIPYGYIYSQSVKNITGLKNNYILDTLYKEHLPIAVINTVIGYRQSAAVPTFETDFYLSKAGFIVLLSLLSVSVLVFIASRWITSSARALATWQQWAIATNDGIHCANPQHVNFIPAMLGQTGQDHISLRVGDVIQMAEMNDFSKKLNMGSKGVTK